MAVWLSHRHAWSNRLSDFAYYLRTHLNFYRLHILFFTFTPLIASGIFYASNGSTHISYIDALFNCVSAVTVCGLATVDLSSLTAWQQVILFIQMCMGSPVVVSWVMVYVRREIFASKFQHVVEAEIARRVEQKVHAPIQVNVLPWWRRAARILLSPKLTTIEESTQSGSEHAAAERGRSGSARLRPEMIRRMNDAPKLINPSGVISEGQAAQLAQSAPEKIVPRESSSRERRVSSIAHTISDETELEMNRELDHGAESEDSISQAKRMNQEDSPVDEPPSPYDRPSMLNRFRAMNGNDPMPRTQTIEFALGPRPDREQDHYYPDSRSALGPNSAASPYNRRMSLPRQISIPRTGTMPRSGTMPRTATMPRTLTLPRTTTTHTHRSMRTKHQGFGGFPMPDEIISRAVNYFFPNLKRQLTRTVTMPRTQTIASTRGGASINPDARPVPYITFEAVVGRNSDFRQLTRDQLEELGGVEYRGLTALLWIVGGYHIGSQLLAFTVIAPYMSIRKWHNDFIPPTLHKHIAPAWFSLFQVVSAYTNTGMSLEDLSMVPFQKAYPMIVFMIYLILAGNTAFPIFLRLLIWILTKIFPKQSRTNETLHFLLDHPRRCFIYLFPSHQTWFLLTVVVFLNVTDWFFFLVLDIGNPAIADIPTGVRVIIGLLQATAVRAAGFGTVTLSALAPAVKVLYVIMMYVSVYPIAMSVRSTNVYEEKSLGVFEEDDESIDEGEFKPTGTRATIWSRYLAMHARKQLSFDMWWLGMALFLVCIIERHSLDDDSKATWFNIFTILFELVSAYGTVGLSLGVPYANYSFSGALRPLSKLILCAVMLRGRHRGLPVAIDRAVILPFEFREPEVHFADDEDDEDDEGGARSRRSFAGPNYNGETLSEKHPPRHDMHRRSWRSSIADSVAERRTSRISEADSNPQTPQS